MEKTDLRRLTNQMDELSEPTTSSILNNGDSKVESTMRRHRGARPSGHDANSIHTLSDLSQDLVALIEHVIVSYNETKGKQFEVKGQAGKNRALTLATAVMKKRSGR